MIRPTLAGLVAFGVASVALTSSASANPAIVIDAGTGRVLYATQATQPWYPASITKLMTTYLALREVRAGRMTMNTPLLVSARAASQVPSKAGFKPGTEITLDNALKIMLVKSANDVAMTIGEAVGGSVERFAGLMNNEAARIGMLDSHFVNPNGLPDPENRTSARDMAILAKALFDEFPEYEDLFNIGAVRLGRRVMNNTNGLVGRYPGAMGMKTGFICSAGFNVVAAAQRGNRRLIAVVLGATNATDRTIRTAELLDYGFNANTWGGTNVTALPPGAGSPPDKWAEVCGHRKGVPSEDDGEDAVTAALGGGSDTGSPFDVFRTNVSGAASVKSATGRGLGPRAVFVPIPVQSGRVPGSTEIARGPIGMDVNVAAGKPALPAEAQAFAPVAADTAATIPTGAGAIPLKKSAGAPMPLNKPGAIGSGGAKAASADNPGAIRRIGKPLAIPDDGALKMAPAAPTAKANRAIADRTGVKPAAVKLDASKSGKAVAGTRSGPVKKKPKPGDAKTGNGAPTKTEPVANAAE